MFVGSAVDLVTRRWHQRDVATQTETPPTPTAGAAARRRHTTARARRHADGPTRARSEHWDALDAMAVAADLCTQFVEVERSLPWRDALRRMQGVDCAVVRDAAGALCGTIDGLALACVVAGGTHHVPLVAVPASTPLGTIAHRLKRGARYVVVVANDDAQRVVRVLSQATLVRHLRATVLDAPTAAYLRTARVVDVGPSALRVARVGDAAQAALAAMHRHGISSMPVVDELGVARGILSVSDLKLLAADVDPSLALALPALAFVAKSRAFQDLVERPAEAVIALAPTATLHAAVDAMTRHRIHHVYVLDLEGKPVSVVSCGDVLRACV